MAGGSATAGGRRATFTCCLAGCACQRSTGHNGPSGGSIPAEVRDVRSMARRLATSSDTWRPRSGGLLVPRSLVRQQRPALVGHGRDVGDDRRSLELSPGRCPPAPWPSPATACPPPSPPAPRKRRSSRDRRARRRASPCRGHLPGRRPMGPPRRRLSMRPGPGQAWASR